MAFLRVSEEEIPNLKSLLEARFPNNSMLLYNRVQFYLRRQTQLEASYNESAEKENTYEEADEVTFHWYSAFPPSTTAIASNFRVQGKSHWVLVAPECETGHELDFVAVSFSIIVNWAEDNVFCGVEEKLYFPLKDLCPPERDEVPKVFHPVYWISVQDALCLPQDLPNANLTLRELSRDEVGLILRSWKYATPQEGPLILAGIQHMGSGALLLNGRLVSWALCMPDGALHGVYTVPDQRGRGYAKVLIKYLSRTLALRGFVPVAQVEVTNAISRALFVSVGFKFSHGMGWISAKGKEDQRNQASQEEEEAHGQLEICEDQ